MPRKAFVEDLQQAIRSFNHQRTSEVKFGVEDGSLTFNYALPTHGGLIVTVQALVTDVGEYPLSHMYMIYTTSENIPADVGEEIQDVGTLDGLRVGDMLSKVTKRLDKATAGSEHDPVNLDEDAMDCDGASTEASEPELQEDSDPESIGAWSPTTPVHPTHASGGVPSRTRSSSMILNANRRIRSDILLAKEAGFRVGHLGLPINDAEDFLITISIRVAKLGISEEAMQAWHLKPHQYFILLLRYNSGYQPLEDLLKANGGPHHSQHVLFRVGLSYRYNVSRDAAMEAFSQTKVKDESQYEYEPIQKQGSDRSSRLYPCFIGTPLQELMNKRLLSIITYRNALGFGWKGAEAWYTDHQGSNWSTDDGVDTKYYGPDTSNQAATLPRVVTNDHLERGTAQPSFPLVAMQFALRHLVRCTEFCLVCHAPVEDDFEALKPYVCSKPLCLYQYMSFGFGPSIEHDIISQPHVVDLLTSFCYASAAAARLKNLPNGLSLSVPAPSLLPLRAGSPVYSGYNSLTDAGNSSGGVTQPESSHAVQSTHTPKRYKAKFDQANIELIIPTGGPFFYTNQWIVLTFPSTTGECFHCRVIEALHPTVRLGPPINRSSLHINLGLQPENRHPLPYQSFAAKPTPPLPQALTPAATPPRQLPGESTRYPDVEIIVYDQNFDDLSLQDKQTTICTLLDTLPSVADMKEYLQSKLGKDMDLRKWQDRISPAAAGVLRWIIASNRSCIIEVDHIEGETLRASEERVTGMSQWMQFRFAQGAPDKEQRFIQSVRDTTATARHPTQYAWHGSPLHNWHSIVREGLHFQDTAHGRAYGHGVYHATNVQISLGYSSGSCVTHDGKSFGTWPHSQLKISQAVALNEIVNAPTQFVSTNPHLVVAQLDWIQTRYLFVRINASIKFGNEVQPSEACLQDPAFTPTGADGKRIVIPITAVSKSRRPVSKAVPKSDKRIKLGRGSQIDDAILLSDDTDIEDLQILLSDHEEPEAVRTQAAPGLEKAAKTDFVPGTLDQDSLQLLKPPTYATSTGTKALQRELNTTLKTQDSRPAHELGWYINRELINNMYQWIIELHSFEPHLPLAKDLKAKGLTSVVMEVRFGKEYPMTPPFARIVRPRFLSFQSGGGGHVTAGGALCMELLTNSGWSAVSNMESVLLQVRLALSSTDPRPARLEQGPVKDYGVGEAIEAYVRACQAHGWQIPPDFRSSYTLQNGQEPLPFPSI
ncbi:MAG: hypothetical protein LQ341_005522 [Variospora aurantia]|nr:MAG: hypothetical protein LQ341_005522 [Variospora aurantia]